MNNVIQSVFPKADERGVRCFKHFQDEMKSAPGLFGVTGRQREYIDDVLGRVDKDGIFNYLADLLDAKSPEEFDATLQSLRQRWVGKRRKVDIPVHVYKNDAESNNNRL